MDRFPEGDDEVDVDVEQCSDSEAPSRASRTNTSNSRATPTSPSDEERLTPEPTPVSIVLNCFLLPDFDETQICSDHRYKDHATRMIYVQFNVI